MDKKQSVNRSQQSCTNDSDMTIGLGPKHRETRGWVVSTVATDALVLKHQAITFHNAD